VALSNDGRAALRANAMFARLSDTDLDAVAAIAEEKQVPKDTLMFRQDETCEGFYLVVDGLVNVFRAGPDGRDTIIHLAGAGETFAEAALLQGVDYPASASTAEASTLVWFAREPFLALVSERPSVSLGMLAGMSQWLRRMVSRIENLTVSESPQRLARFLLELKLRGGPGERYIELPARKYLVAGQLGMTAPTFSRCLARLENAGLVKVEGRKLFVLNPEGLDELAGG
jgi:CRP/FNR family transcriptional regulator